MSNEDFTDAELIAQINSMTSESISDACLSRFVFLGSDDASNAKWMATVHTPIIEATPITTEATPITTEATPITEDRPAIEATPIIDGTLTVDVKVTYDKPKAIPRSHLDKKRKDGSYIAAIAHANTLNRLHKGQMNTVKHLQTYHLAVAKVYQSPVFFFCAVILYPDIFVDYEGNFEDDTMNIIAAHPTLWKDMMNFYGNYANTGHDIRGDAKLLAKVVV